MSKLIDMTEREEELDVLLEESKQHLTREQYAKMVGRLEWFHRHGFSHDRVRYHWMMAEQGCETYTKPDGYGIQKTWVDLTDEEFIDFIHHGHPCMAELAYGFSRYDIQLFYAGLNAKEADDAWEAYKEVEPLAKPHPNWHFLEEENFRPFLHFAHAKKVVCRESSYGGKTEAETATPSKPTISRESLAREALEAELAKPHRMGYGNITADVLEWTREIMYQHFPELLTVDVSNIVFGAHGFVEFAVHMPYTMYRITCAIPEGGFVALSEV